jgi:RNA polymerase primary sigma factor
MSNSSFSNRSSDPTDAVVRDLLEQCRKWPLLGPAEERALAKRVEQGSTLAKDRMVQSNLRLVVSIARGYQGHDVPLADLIQDGVIGLIRAVEKFDWRRGYRFSTYATLWIRQAISASLVDGSRAIRLPPKMARAAVKVARTETDLARDLGRAPTEDEVADVIGVPVDKLRLINQVDRKPVSLDLPVGEQESAPLGHTIASDEPAVEETVFRVIEGSALTAAVDELGDDERTIIALRYGRTADETSHSAESVARQLGRAAHDVRKVEKRALAAMRESSTLSILAEAA